MALSFVTLYRPSYHLVRAMAMRVVTPEQSYELLDQAATQLARTLHIDQQVYTLCNAIQSAFDAPQIACYVRHEPHPSVLSLAYNAGFQFPNLLPDGKLIDCLAQLPNVASVRSLYLATRADTLSEAESELLHQPGIALWCSIRHAEGPLLGLLLVGMRANLDPYRSSDLRELRRLVDAAVLAFTNSTAYTALAHSEATVRRLYKRYQEIQLATASASPANSTMRLLI